MNITDLFALVERLAPPRMAASWDRCGVQVAGAHGKASRLAVALDPLPATLAQALDWGAQAVLTHHPLGKTPRLPDRRDAHREALKLLLGRDAWLYAAHTSLDCAPGGPAAWLADELGLSERAVVDPQGETRRVMAFYKEVAMDGFDAFQLPEGLDVDRLHFDRDALRHAPQAFSCPEPHWPALRAALQACPDVSSMAGAVSLVEPSEPYGYGIVGRLPSPMGWDDFLAELWRLLPRAFLSFAGEAAARVERVAYCTGSGASCGARAFALGADVFLTGDVPHHFALDLAPLGLTVDCGHHVLEQEMMRRFAGRLADETRGQELEVRFFESPDPLRAALRPS
ncbi:GTP cyclohydrolase 1 type 2 [Fundidesulfovibrio magnetotacticus]|uniref:GTP cyclohydrolase 1 type 2 homolog n=1 Tax=Fundidesulfovibrio magnetotacticus TaxID=2730080 RepID=A0A6V8LU52_9BACT|nr:Nif3-like dinuclear metal center hexameric protein [Fundidesulfovibrio magnetotacticus]GFK94480.1 GTP cyclohydrolase 1 type 2 [Fundidesulfovibrio magnetotacticus]